jgi:hypothetical protein
MYKILSTAQVERYRSDGFAFPLPVLDAGGVRELRADLEYWEKHLRQDQGFTEAAE